MEGQVLLVITCCVTVVLVLGETQKTVDNSVKDKISDASAPRLYRSAPYSIYASAAPYRSYSFRMPSFTVDPKVAASQLVPVKEETIVVRNTNGYLKDSYGNKFVNAPQSLAFKTTMPQQYVQLQDLPAHLSQPLVAVSPSFQVKHTVLPYFYGPQYKASALTSPVYGIGGYSHPVVYADRLRSFSPGLTFNHGNPTAQHQSSNNKVVYASQGYNNLKNEPKHQQVKPNQNKASENNKGNLETAQAQQTVTLADGQKVVVDIETKPPLPLLDLSLLEPLTFNNPIVPQVQHFLPKISSVRYHKLPEITINEEKKHNNEIIVQKTKSYDSGVIAEKPKKDIAPKSKQPPPQELHHDEDDEAPQNPQQHPSVQGIPQDEISYEINSPKYKETYNEQVVKYEKETKPEPVQYSYNSDTQKEPVTYSYSHHSKEPSQTKHLEYSGNGDPPKQLIYNLSPQDQYKESKNSNQVSYESGESEYHPNYNAQNHPNEEAPQKNYHYEPEHREQEYHRRPNQEIRHGNEHPKSQEYEQRPNYAEILQKPRPVEHHKSSKVESAQHKSHKEHGNEKKIINNVAHHGKQKQYHQPIVTTFEIPQEVQAITPEYDEDIRILPTHQPHTSAPLTVDPFVPLDNQQPSPLPQYYQKSHQESQEQDDSPKSNSYHRNPSKPEVIEKSKRIIIQEDSPDEMHSHSEHLMAEMIKEQENDEKEFEEAYKQAAFGFPSYEKQSEEIEKHIYNPETYGAPRYTDYQVDYRPFEQYQSKNEDLPKKLRDEYKDAREHTQDDYYLDYSVSKPDSLLDRHKSKVAYYKMYEKNRPEHYFSTNSDNDRNKKEKQSAKYTLWSPHSSNPAPQEQKQKNYFAHYKAAPVKYQYSYPKSQKDSYAHATRPLQRFTAAKTNFVEPQFQYGFEPISIPRLLDSELAAMASNDSPESETPGTRKKVYKENWYIKKTRTSGADPSS